MHVTTIVDALLEAEPMPGREREAEERFLLYNVEYFAKKEEDFESRPTLLCKAVQRALQFGVEKARVERSALLLYGRYSTISSVNSAIWNLFGDAVWGGSEQVLDFAVWVARRHDYNVEEALNSCLRMAVMARGRMRIARHLLAIGASPEKAAAMCRMEGQKPEEFWDRIKHLGHLHPEITAYNL